MAFSTPQARKLTNLKKETFLKEVKHIPCDIFKNKVNFSEGNFNGAQKIRNIAKCHRRVIFEESKFSWDRFLGNLEIVIALEIKFIPQHSTVTRPRQLPR